MPRVHARWLALALLALVPACDLITGGSGGKGPPAEITELPRPLSATEVAVLRASNGFGLELLHEIAREAPGATHFLSPLSASMALGMALNGADGDTYEAMRGTLGFDGLSRDDINATYLGLIELLADLDPAVSFSVANSVWYQETWTLRTTFREIVEEAFSAQVTGLDLQAPDAAGRINAWVRDATGGRIQQIAPDPIPEDMVAYLLNAIHFKGDWRAQFDAAKTQDADFRLEDGSTATIRLMRQDGKFHFGHLRGRMAVDLAYGGNAYSMTLVLPRGGEPFGELLAELDADAWEELVASFGPEPVTGTVEIPRFRLEWEAPLNDALTRMGMGVAFSDFADFSLLFEDEAALLIDEVRQKTFLRVDEEGTEAAAVTQVGVMPTSMPPTFTADRPFLLAIRESLSGTILFLGAIVEAPVD